MRRIGFQIKPSQDPCVRTQMSGSLRVTGRKQQGVDGADRMLRWIKRGLRKFVNVVAIAALAESEVRPLKMNLIIRMHLLIWIF